MNTAIEESGEDFLHGDLTRRILGEFFDVYNELRSGYLESVYRAALVLALREAGLHVEELWPVDVYFRGQIIGRFRADILVEERVILELKAVRAVLPEHEAQLMHYLRATTIEVGLLLNFGREAEFKRMVFANSRKRAVNLPTHRPHQCDEPTAPA